MTVDTDTSPEAVRPPSGGSGPAGATTAATDTRDGTGDQVDIGASTHRRGPSNRLAWALAILGLIGTIGFALAWQSARSDDAGASSVTTDGPSASMVEAARAFSVALTNFDGATIDRDFDRLVAMSSGEFRGQADEFFSSKVRKELKEAQASSRGEVRSAYVQTFDGDRGTAFVVVDQTIANNASPKPKADTLRMELTLVRTDGRWAVSRVAVLTAPSGGTTGATPAGAGTASGN